MVLPLIGWGISELAKGSKKGNNAPAWSEMVGGKDKFGGQEAQDVLRQKAAEGMQKLMTAPDQAWTSQAALRSDLAEGQAEIARMGAASGTQEKRAAMGLSDEQRIGAMDAERKAQLDAQLGAQAQLSAGLRDQYQKLGETRRKNLEDFALGVIAQEGMKEQQENQFLQQLIPDMLSAAGSIASAASGGIG
tara:strand:+ start:266 stop:838 length:573 start_codon:yes stop_codon:yes gene_type:complete